MKTAFCRSILIVPEEKRRFRGGGAILLFASALLLPISNRSQELPERPIKLMEAVQSVLAKDPLIKIQQQQAQQSKGAWESASGQFDWTLDSELSQGLVRTPRTEFERILNNPAIADEVQDITNYRVGFNKQFRSGVSITPSVELTRLGDNLGSEGALNRANINFVINVPLLKGFGTETTGALEKAARITYEAGVLEVQQVVAQRVLNVVQNYWNAVAAARQVQVYRQSEDRSIDLVNKLGELVKANEYPSADLRQVMADQADKESTRIFAQERLFQALQSLALAMGLDYQAIAIMPMPTDAMPVPEGLFNLKFTGQPLLDRGLSRRADYQSSLKNEEAAVALRVAAKNNLKPQLDLNFEAGYSGLEEGSRIQKYFSSLDPRAVAGPNVLGTIRFSYPFGNHSARGLLVQREASYQQTILRSQEMARTISSGFLTAWNELELSLHELQRAQVASRGYVQTMENEREKLSLGNSTVVDVITIADRVANAQINEINAHTRYANAIARLRYEAGLLIPAGSSPPFEVKEADFLTQPTQKLLEEIPAKH